MLFSVFVLHPDMTTGTIQNMGFVCACLLLKGKNNPKTEDNKSRRNDVAMHFNNVEFERAALELH